MCDTYTAFLGVCTELYMDPRLHQKYTVLSRVTPSVTVFHLTPSTPKEWNMKYEHDRMQYGVEPVACVVLGSDIISGHW